MFWTLSHSCSFFSFLTPKWWLQLFPGKQSAGVVAVKEHHVMNRLENWNSTERATAHWHLQMEPHYTLSIGTAATDENICIKTCKVLCLKFVVFFFSWGFLIVFLQTYSFTYCALYMYECLFICTCQIASSSHHSVQLFQIFLLFFWRTCGTKMIGLRKLLSRWNSRIW